MNLRRRGSAPCLAAVLAVALLVAPPATASASRWATRTVTYRDASGLHRTVRAAVALWNHSVHGVRLVPARPGARAMIRVVARTATTCGSAGCGRYPPDGRVELARSFVRLGGTRPVDDARNPVRVGVVAHEIGHALGLRHSSHRCDLMYAVVTLCAAVRAGSGDARCGPQPRDVAALARLYGVRRRHATGLCRLVALPRGELLDRGPLVVAGPPPATGRHAVRLRVRNRSGRTWGLGAGELAVELLLAGEPTRATCDQSHFSILDARVAPGGTATFLVPLCVAPGAVDLRLRTSAQLADASRVVVPAERWGPLLPSVHVLIDDAPTVAIVDATTPQHTDMGWEATFVAQAHDDESPPPTLQWDFGDGTEPETGSSVSHVFAAPGTYVVTVTATDVGGQTATATTTVTAEPDPAPPEEA